MGRKKIRIFILILIFLISACATVEPRKPIEVVEVKVPVSVPCIDKAPVRPSFKTGNGDYPGGIIAAQNLIIDFELLEKYATAWEVAAAGCMKK